MAASQVTTDTSAARANEAIVHDTAEKVGPDGRSHPKESRGRLARYFFTIGGCLVGAGVILLGLATFHESGGTPNSILAASSFVLDGIGFVVFSLGFAIPYIP